jgi:hypothetical protein
VSDSKYLHPDGLLSKFREGVTFLADNTEFPASLLRDTMSEFHWVQGGKDASGNPVGSQNEVMGIIVSSNTGKSRGKRVRWLLVDELGTFGNFMEWWAASMPNVQEGADSFGQFFATGTGGTEGSSFEGALDLIYSPESNYVYGLPNVYDKNSQGNRTTVYFFPSYMNYHPYYNKDGVSDVIAAMLHELSFRHNMKMTSTDLMKVTQRRAEYAFTLKDAIMRRDGTIFPVAELNDAVNNLDNHPERTNAMYVGRLKLDGGVIVFQPDANLTPVTQYPHKDNKLKGCVYIRTMPVQNKSGEISSDRYAAGADVIAVDGAATLSLFACYVLDMYTDELVASYVGREDLVDDSFEICRRLLLFYNARCNYENNKNGMFRYFSQHGCLYLLTDNLEFLQDKESSSMRIGNARKGTPSSKPVKSYGLRCLRDWLLKPVPVGAEINDDGEEVQKSVYMLHTIPFRALLQECSAYSEDLNCDEVDAMIMLMLLREDRLRLAGEEGFSESRVEGDYLGRDPFFEKNYRGGQRNEKWSETLKRLGYKVT